MAAVTEENATVNDVESEKTIEDVKTVDDTTFKTDDKRGKHIILLIYCQKNGAVFLHCDRRSLGSKITWLKLGIKKSTKTIKLRIVSSILVFVRLRKNIT